MKFTTKLVMGILCAMILTQPAFGSEGITSGEDVPQELEKASEGEGAALKTEEESSPWRVSLGLSRSSGSEVKFANVWVKAGGATTVAKAEMDLEEVLSLEFDVRMLKPQSWGMIFGLSYDLPRRVKGGKITSVLGGTVTYPSSDEKLQSTVISANAAFRWDQFYIPFGLNVSMLDYLPASGFTGSSTATGGMGGQVGLGFYISEHAALEVYSRVISGHLDIEYDTNTRMNYGTGHLSSLQLTAKYVF